MPVTKITEPIFRKTSRGLEKAGYQVITVTTNKKGEVLKSVITRSKIYK